MKLCNTTMRARHASTWMLTALLCLASTARGPAAPSGSNGVYGGYVGSSAWFSSMTQQAIVGGGNATWQAAIRRGLRTGALVETRLHVGFPGGNPFPGGQVPNLNVLGPNGKDTGSNPYAVASGRFGADYYLILHKGWTYRLCWLYLFGQKEVFARLPVGRPHGYRVSLSVLYHPAPPRRGPVATHSSSYPAAGHHTVPPHSDKNWAPPHSDKSWAPPHSDKNWAPPHSDKNWAPPQSDKNWAPPHSDKNWAPPHSDKNWAPPHSDNGTDKSHTSAKPAQHRKDKGWAPPHSDQAYQAPTSGK